MSAVTVTDLEPGTAATSAGVNDTLTSFNSATAAGQLNGSNVRMEGVDRRSMSGANHVVFTTETGSDTVVASTANSGLVNSPAPTATVITAGIAMQTNSMTIAATSWLLLHANAYMESASRNTGQPRLSVTVFLQASTDAGATWATLSGTVQLFRMRETANLCSNAANPKIPGIKGTYGCTYGVAGNGVATLYRIAFTTTNDSSVGGNDVNFINATLFPEILGA